MSGNRPQKTILIGSGALARDIVGVFGRDAFVGTFVDEGFPASPVEGLPVITDWDVVRRCASHYFLGILDSAHRIRARQYATSLGLIPVAPMIHHSAQVAPDARLSPGCLVGYFSVIGPSSELQEDVMVMHSAVVAHDTVIGENSVVLPGAWIGGFTRIGEGCFIGANSSLVPHITIGSNSFVAAGAVCFRDALPNSMLLGNPARRNEIVKKYE
ncbi:MAG: DapH/DapD/GlmU-related protein [Pelobacteraceae bacterium]